ncbi:MAG: DUF99 family protein [Thermoplasmataceae archaeon]|jgi:endonuclease V-like protein UPF0215 family
MKKFSRVLGIDDGPFNRKQNNDCSLIGIIYRFDGLIEKILIRRITVDGLDTTEAILSMLNEYGGPVEAVVSEGITFGGFNIPDPLVFMDKNLRYISYSTRAPDINSMHMALKKYHLEENLRHLKEYESVEIETLKGKFTANLIGIDKIDARTILQKTMLNGKKCEPVRVAHMIGKALGSYSLNI